MQSLTQALQSDLDPLKAKHADATLEYEKQKEKFRALREEWGRMQDKVELFEKRIKQLNELETEIKGLSKQKAELQTEVDAFPKVKKDLDEALAALKKAQDKLQGLEDELTKIEAAIKEKQAALSDIDSQIFEKAKTLKDLDEQIAAKDKERNKIEQELHDVNVNLDARKNELKTIGQIPEEAFKSLRTPWLESVKTPAKSGDEITALDRLNQLVTQSGFELSKRLQYAFHTSLKTSDISCLTVMAGVSGTGKSAFPKLYAQAMGIHFLPLAVEPRWDSPQDLFGFLNYMENRYEATTLGRALVQFNNSELADSHSNMSDQVLIVLLDEMNLARIEYYFSEFLSKLEMRRNSDPNAIEDYNNISLEVFAGYPAEKDKPGCSAIRLFAGYNVLFVGTMNEDESTQSLSDKVIDRANVIHFGRPEKLKNVTLMPTNQRQTPISYTAWRDWVREPDAGISPHIEKILNDINSVLGDLGRPFGWRNYKAILTYVANYPDSTDPMRPLADQIAMRVMPKLRGIDLSEYSEIFNRMHSLLNLIGDQALMDAFDEARGNTMGFFNWRGLNWDS